MTQKVIKSYLLFGVLFHLPFSFCFVIYVLFLLENKMTLMEVGLINSSFMISMMLFEIPTGVIADFFGRKISVVLGVFCCSLCMLTYFLSHSFWGFILAETIMALGGSLISGALDAWIKDSLDFYGYHGRLGEILAKGEFYKQLSLIAGGLIGALIGNYSLRLPWLLAAIGVFIAGLASWRLLTEDYFQKRQLKLKDAFTGMKKITVDSVKYGFQNKQVWNLILIASVFAISQQAMNMQCIPFFKEKLGMWSTSIIWVGISSLLALGAFVSGRAMKKGVKGKTLLLLSILIISVTLFISTLFENGWIILAFFWTHELGRGLYNPAHQECLQENIPSDKRATVVSFQSMVAKIGSASGWLAAGFLGTIIPTLSCWQISAALFLLAIPFILRLKSSPS